ncbi:MAG: acetyl-CoA carboxylase biotin carboxyl carrier protein [Candidatus Coatesbacteria bacterium]|nr:acetyl-CoA carboxylase biotin carboxyl carrier protein [Candidatus Coatesbacteria bacterium]
MDIESIKQLMQLMASCKVSELEYEAGDMRLKLRRFEAAPQTGSGALQIVQPEIVSLGEPTATSSGEPSEADYAIVKSPIVGTFYRAPAPAAEPFVSTGDYVSKGKTLCIVEAMKVMNEIESDFDGKVIKILINDAQPVEYGQPLMWIEPS